MFFSLLLDIKDAAVVAGHGQDVAEDDEVPGVSVRGAGHAAHPGRHQLPGEGRGGVAWVWTSWM